jgi:hypothetical protein
VFKRRQAVLLIAAVLVVFLAAAQLWRQREPAWQGRPFSFWLDEWETHQRLGPGYCKEPVARVQSALDSIGTNALPQLIRWVEAEELPLRTRMNTFLQGQSWVSFRFQTALEKHCLAESGFCYFGQTAKPLQPALLELIRNERLDSDRYQRFCCAFFFTGPEKATFLPLCRTALCGPNNLLRSIAAQWIVELYPEEARRIVRERDTACFDLVREHLQAASASGEPGF